MILWLHVTIKDIINKWKKKSYFTFTLRVKYTNGKPDYNILPKFQFT